MTPKEKKPVSANERALIETLLPSERAGDRKDFVEQMINHIAARSSGGDRGGSEQIGEPLENSETGQSGSEGVAVEKTNLDGQALEIDGEKIFDICEEYTDEKADQERNARERKQEEKIVQRLREREKRKPGFRLIGMEERLSKEKENEERKRPFSQSAPRDPFLSRLKALEAEERGLKESYLEKDVKAVQPRQAAFTGIVAEKDPPKLAGALASTLSGVIDGPASNGYQNKAAPKPKKVSRFKAQRR